MSSALELVLITGMSGSGKSVAIAALEDAGFFCVDNLPPELLEPFIDLQHQNGNQKIGVAVDVRSATSLPVLPGILGRIGRQGVRMTTLFLDATDDVLLRRFSETRRSHPLSKASDGGDRHALIEAIRLERELTAELRENAHIIDTSLMRPARLLSQIKDTIQSTESHLTLVFESFAFKRGMPMDADYVFDVRMLPNPHYEPSLRALTGKDAAVADYLHKEPAVGEMLGDIEGFLNRWLPALLGDHRSYVTVAVGCTGGQHRSVYLVERLTERFKDRWHARSRHRELQP